MSAQLPCAPAAAGEQRLPPIASAMGFAKPSLFNPAYVQNDAAQEHVGAGLLQLRQLRQPQHDPPHDPRSCFPWSNEAQPRPRHVLRVRPEGQHNLMNRSLARSRLRGRQTLGTSSGAANLRPRPPPHSRDSLPTICPNGKALSNVSHGQCNGKTGAQARHAMFANAVWAHPSSLPQGRFAVAPAAAPSAAPRCHAQPSPHAAPPWYRCRRLVLPGKAGGALPRHDGCRPLGCHRQVRPTSWTSAV